METMRTFRRRLRILERLQKPKPAEDPLSPDAITRRALQRLTDHELELLRTVVAANDADHDRYTEAMGAWETALNTELNSSA